MPLQSPNMPETPRKTLNPTLQPPRCPESLGPRPKKRADMRVPGIRQKVDREEMIANIAGLGRDGTRVTRRDAKPNDSRTHEC